MLIVNIYVDEELELKPRERLNEIWGTTQGNWI